MKQTHYFCFDSWSGNKKIQAKLPGSLLSQFFVWFDFLDAMEKKKVLLWDIHLLTCKTPAAVDNHMINEFTLGRDRHISHTVYYPLQKNKMCINAI